LADGKTFLKGVKQVEGRMGHWTDLGLRIGESEGKKQKGRQVGRSPKKRSTDVSFPKKSRQFFCGSQYNMALWPALHWEDGRIPYFDPLALL
jgi:hypothetical protein